MTLAHQAVADAPTDLLAILGRVEASLRPNVCCAACGCLCRPTELCPSCYPEAIRR